MSEKTIALTGAETEVHFSGGNAWLRNDGASAVYASKTAGITAGADGVVSIPAGGSAPVYGANGTVYLLGSGSVQIIGSDYATNPFKTSAQAGGSGADDVARAAIEAHAGNAEIHVTAEEKVAWNSKAEMSDITNKSTAQSLINCLDIADAVPHDEDYFIVQYAGGGTERTDFYRKPTSKLYDYIRNKLVSSCSFRGKDTGFIYAFLNGSSGVSLNDIKYESHRFAFNVTDYPSEAGISYGFLDVDYFDGEGFAPVRNGIVRQTWTKYNDPSKTWTRLYISSSETEGTWTDWVRTSNDRNADTVDGKHASDFVLKTDYDALAARVAALEEAIIVSNGETTE